MARPRSCRSASSIRSRWRTTRVSKGARCARTVWPAKIGTTTPTSGCRRTSRSASLGSVQLVVPIVVVLVLLAVAAPVLVTRRRRGRSSELTRPREEEDTHDDASPARQIPDTVRGQGLGARVRALFGAGVSDDTWAGLEDLLIRADVGPVAAGDIVGRLREDYRLGVDPSELLRDELVGVLGEDEPLRLDGDELAVVMVVGVNGSGKTTTIGKLARRLVT